MKNLVCPIRISRFLSVDLMDNDQRKKSKISNVYNIFYIATCSNFSSNIGLLKSHKNDFYYNYNWLYESFSLRSDIDPF